MSFSVILTKSASLISLIPRATQLFVQAIKREGFQLEIKRHFLLGQFLFAILCKYFELVLSLQVT